MSVINPKMMSDKLRMFLIAVGVFWFFAFTTYLMFIFEVEIGLGAIVIITFLWWGVPAIFIMKGLIGRE